MDAIVILIALISVYFQSTVEVRKIEEAVSPEDPERIVKTKLNPDFHRDDKAFLSLYTAIVKKGHPKP